MIMEREKGKEGSDGRKQTCTQKHKQTRRQKIRERLREQETERIGEKGMEKGRDYFGVFRLIFLSVKNFLN